MEIKGVITAMLTPMKADESIDLAQMRRLTRRQLDAGIHGLFIAGTNGEGYALSSAEKLALADAVLQETNGRVPVFFGSGMCTTRETIALSLEAQRLGVDALSIVCPYFAAASQEGLYAHFAAVAQAVDLPIILYNIPARTGVNLTPATVARLAQVDNIVGIKDSSGNFEQMLSYLEAVPPDFNVLCGNDALLLWSLLAGGRGGICGVANLFPQRMASIYEHWAAGDLAAARRAQDSIRPFRALFRLGSSVSVIKAAAKHSGLSAGPVRRPFGLTDPDAEAAIEAFLHQNSMQKETW